MSSHPSQDREQMLAHFYDLEYRDYLDDIDFYVQYALALDPERELAVLELGCGTGRVIEPLAEAGFRVVGLDSSQAMLDLAQTRIESRGVGESIELICGDMRNPPEAVQGPFNMALCALNTFSYLCSTEDQLAMLNAVRMLLVQHGILILDLTPPFENLISQPDGTLIHQGSFADQTSGDTLHKFVSALFDVSTQIQDTTLFYDLEGLDGNMKRYNQQIKMRWTGRYEMDLLLRLAGYRIEKIYGSYDLDDFTQASERMIFVART